MFSPVTYPLPYISISTTISINTLGTVQCTQYNNTFTSHSNCNTKKISGRYGRLMYSKAYM